MFRRTTPADSTPTDDAALLKEGGKGRPTPSRREAEAAAKARAKAGMDKKAAQKLLRERQADRNQKMRTALKTGEEKFLPARDQGPVKRFIRDWIDSRLCVAEFLLPLLLIGSLLLYSNNARLMDLGNGLSSATFLLTLVDTTWLIFKLKRALRAKFPNEDLKGVTSYALLRVLQVRFARRPAAMVGVGGRPKKPKAPKR